VPLLKGFQTFNRRFKSNPLRPSKEELNLISQVVGNWRKKGGAWPPPCLFSLAVILSAQKYIGASYPAQGLSAVSLQRKSQTRWRS